jgi:hypothetical protein
VEGCKAHVRLKEGAAAGDTQGPRPGAAASAGYYPGPGMGATWAVDNGDIREAEG